MNNRFKKIILLSGDIVILYAALYATLLVRYFHMPDSAGWFKHFWPFTVTFIAWILVFYISDLYNLHLAVNDEKFFRLTLRSVTIASVLSAIYFYSNPNISIAPKTNLIIYLIIFTIFFILWRRLFNKLLLSYLPKNNIAVIGYNPQVKELTETLISKPHLGYKIKLIISDNVTDSINPVPITNSIEKLTEIVSKQKVSTIILASDLNNSTKLRSALFSYLPYNINFISLTNFYETISGKVPIEAINQMWFLKNLSEGKKIWYNRFKSFYDFIFALIILIITSLFWPLIGLIIRLESKGSIFFTQKRVGKNNKNFKLIKFRSMREENNDRSLTKSKDTRITKFGSFMRKSRIDEIPQILNIILGDMSFIGPRPEQPKFTKELEQEVPFYNERNLVKPGVTGWAQTMGGYLSPTKEDTLKKLQYDLFYIKHRSLYLDITIILKTIATVLRRGGR